MFADLGLEPPAGRPQQKKQAPSHDNTMRGTVSSECQLEWLAGILGAQFIEDTDPDGRTRLYHLFSAVSQAKIAIVVTKSMHSGEQPTTLPGDSTKALSKRTSGASGCPEA